MDLGGPYSLEPGEPYRFLNHSCDPNCELLLIDVEDEDGRLLLPEIWLSALRDIEPGEELTIDYGWPAEQGIRCTCGSANCRGWIAAETEPLPETPEPAVPTVQNAG
jgi:SET domain-containing protein